MSKRSRILWIIIIQVIIIVCIGVFPNLRAIGWQSQEGNSLDVENILDATIQIYMISLTDEIAAAGLPNTNLSVAQVHEHLGQGWGYDMGRGLGDPDSHSRRRSDHHPRSLGRSPANR